MGMHEGETKYGPKDHAMKNDVLKTPSQGSGVLKSLVHLGATGARVLRGPMQNQGQGKLGSHGADGVRLVS